MRSNLRTALLGTSGASFTKLLNPTRANNGDNFGDTNISPIKANTTEDSNCPTNDRQERNKHNKHDIPEARSGVREKLAIDLDNSRGRAANPTEEIDGPDKEMDRRLAQYDELFFKYGGQALQKNESTAVQQISIKSQKSNLGCMDCHVTRP